MFKFAVDSHSIYGGDRWAAKAAGYLIPEFGRFSSSFFIVYFRLELLGFSTYFNANIPGLSLPLVAVVDFMGFRLFAGFSSLVFSFTSLILYFRE